MPFYFHVSSIFFTFITVNANIFLKRLLLPLQQNNRHDLFTNNWYCRFCTHQLYRCFSSAYYFFNHCKIRSLQKTFPCLLFWFFYPFWQRRNSIVRFNSRKKVKGLSKQNDQYDPCFNGVWSVSFFAEIDCSQLMADAIDVLDMKAVGLLNNNVAPPGLSSSIHLCVLP